MAAARQPHKRAWLRQGVQKPVHLPSFESGAERLADQRRCQKAYLAGTDSGVSTRTWQQALDAIIETKSGSTQDRWRRAAKETALDSIRNRIILEAQAEHLLACLKAGTVSTNVHLPKLHNFCISMNWLPWPLIPKRL